MTPGHAVQARTRLERLPKVELHRHAEGAMRLETLWAFHCEHDLRLYETQEQLRAAAVIPKGEQPGFLAFLERFNALRFYYGSHAAIARLGYEAVEDAAREGIVYLELRFSPIFFARRMLKSDRVKAQLTGTPAQDAPPPASLVAEAAQAYIEGARSAAQSYAIAINFLLTLGRHFGVEANRPAAELLHGPLGDAFAGLDLAGDERVPLSSMDALIRPWLEAGKFLTVHAGEFGPASNVCEALEDYHAHRIGHGIAAVQNRKALELIKDREVVLELCPSSNLQTQAVRNWSEYPLNTLLNAGIKASINTDDPLICGVDLIDEYLFCSTQLGLSERQLATLALNGAKGAFMGEAQRRVLIERIKREWQRNMEVEPYV